MVTEIKDADFKKEVEDHEGLVLVDFWASWCGPCQSAAPIVDSVADEMKNKVKVVKLNVDENQSTASKFGVMSIPTFIFFRDGKEVERKVGLQSKEEFARIVESLKA
ncbi:MAG: thioredoxin [Candidatus Moraniibacteriota bacterium]